MADLMRGEGTREDYIALVVQHWYIYEALERAAERMRRDPVAAVFISDRLTRLPALEADLEFLIGPDWRDRIAPLPTTQALRRSHRPGRRDVAGRLRRPPLHPLPRRPVGRPVHRSADGAPVRLRDQRHRLLPLRRHRRPARRSRRSTASSWMPRPGMPPSRSASSTRCCWPTASTPSCSTTSPPPRRPRSPEPGIRPRVSARPDRRRETGTTRSSRARSGLAVRAGQDAAAARRPP